MAQLIAIEGIDGSGKGTQAAMLRDRLVSEGRQVALLSFPRYQDTFFGRRIGEFLNGRFGGLNEIHPFLVSLLYAGDRLESRDTLQAALDTHDVVVLDRYVASNIAHQCAKLPESDQPELQKWIETIEFGLNRLPKPDVTVLFDLPAESAQRLISLKSQRSYTDRKADLQEADTAYLERVRQVYLRLAASEAGWQTVEVERAGMLKERSEICDHVTACVFAFSEEKPKK
jgi:dTMP kinase